MNVTHFAIETNRKSLQLQQQQKNEIYCISYDIRLYNT